MIQPRERVLLGLELLDRQLRDRNDRLCGKVDDIELEVEDNHAEVAAMLSGPGTWSRRLPGWLGAIARRIAGSDEVRIGWWQVGDAGDSITLTENADDLLLARGDTRTGRWLGRLPRA